MPQAAPCWCGEMAPSDLGEYELPIDCHAGLPCDAVELRLLPSHARRIDAEVEASVSAEWEAKLAKHPRLFNGRKFRYGGARVAEGGDGVRLQLELGLTDYRAMVGTNLSPRFGELLGHDPRLLANALGNGAVVETSDGCVMLLLRSPQMLEAPNTFVFPGGHPAPQLVRLGARPRPRLLRLGRGLGGTPAPWARLTPRAEAQRRWRLRHRRFRLTLLHVPGRRDEI